MRALNASMPPYVTEYRGGRPPWRTSGRCFNASSSHHVTWAMISRTDHRPVTPGIINCESDRSAYDCSKSFHAASSRSSTCCRFIVSPVLSLLNLRSDLATEVPTPSRNLRRRSAVGWSPSLPTLMIDREFIGLQDALAGEYSLER